MTVKEHYDNHLGYFYSWMSGNPEEKKDEFLTFCKTHHIFPEPTDYAIDLGAGNGIQSLALAELGYKVIAIDFNKTLLDELDAFKKDLQIEIVHDDLRKVLTYKSVNPKLIVCCGDTIAHLDSENDVFNIIGYIYKTLVQKGKAIFSFRDYSTELIDVDRFVPVKSDGERILTCFLEYSDKKIKVTDLLHERSGNGWIQKVSSYEKVRITKEMILNMLNAHGFSLVAEETMNRMISLVVEKCE